MVNKSYFFGKIFGKMFNPRHPEEKSAFIDKFIWTERFKTHLMYLYAKSHKESRPKATTTKTRARLYTHSYICCIKI